MTASVLFDLDGTLADTAPDLGLALNLMRAARGLEPLPITSLRIHASSGARGMIGVGLGVSPEHPDYPDMRDEFLDLYERNLKRHTTLFEEVEDLLDALDELRLPWGIVTNKAERFTLPLLRLLGLADRAGCVVGGDTTPHAKPHPAPLLEAARRLDVDPALCCYVGDDVRDITAARAAGMRGVVAGYGYLGTGPCPEHWGADAIVARPLELLKHLPPPPSVG
jgi:phosphoglycolate phosphatase